MSAGHREVPGVSLWKYTRTPILKHIRNDRSRSTVGVYDRPHPLRTRKVLVPLGIFVLIAIVYALYFLLR
jgi:hypothetical protein